MDEQSQITARSRQLAIQSKAGVVTISRPDGGVMILINSNNYEYGLKNLNEAYIEIVITPKKVVEREN
jgi:hypothetical protein